MFGWIKKIVSRGTRMPQHRGESAYSSPEAYRRAVRAALRGEGPPVLEAGSFTDRSPEL